MSKVLIIGAGGVGNVVAQKCAQAPEVFGEITLASRTLAKCDAIAADIRQRTGQVVRTAQVDADNVAETVDLIRRVRPALVLNLAQPYQDLPLMDACLETKVDYLDTANYEPPDDNHFEYKYQWAYHERFKEAGIMAVLGCGFDPGATSVFCTYVKKHHLDEIHTIDIVDCNGGDHGRAFATNFTPETNIRELTLPGQYWEDGQWHHTEPMEIHQPFDFPQIGEREMYLIHHEEIESLARYIPEARRIRFWMTFGESYLTHLRVLENVGMTGIEPVMYEGHPVIPVRFLKALLPDPASLAKDYTGLTCIGCVIAGLRDGAPRRVFIYNICDHEACYKEVGAQAISYTAGAPAMMGAKLVLQKKWQGQGVFNVEQLDPDPFMEAMNEHGLPWQIVEWGQSVE